jgi:hypothetical protein
MRYWSLIRMLRNERITSHVLGLPVQRRLYDDSKPVDVMSMD